MRTSLSKYLHFPGETDLSNVTWIVKRAELGYKIQFLPFQYCALLTSVVPLGKNLKVLCYERASLSYPLSSYRVAEIMIAGALWLFKV